MAAEPKKAFTFGFAKKAEPKKYVAALSTKKADDREEIKGLDESGKVVLEKPKDGQGPLVIKCKNPLDGTMVPKKLEANLPNGEKPKALAKPLEECAGGIVTNNIAKLSDADAEAARELLKDASREDGDPGDAPAPMPILMKAGSKKIRDGLAGGSAPEATREMFENVPVESYGEAMLRGMGYDPGVHTVKPIFRDKLRDNCLGLGAKALLPGEKLLIQGKRKAAPKAAAAGRVSANEVSSKSSIAASAEDEVAEEAAASSPVVDVEAEQAQKKRRTEEAEAAADVWASRGLVVRVIGKGAALKDFFGAEAVVLKVDEGKGVCKIKARPNGSDKSQQLEGVKLEDIETRVSRDCQKVRIVRGTRKGLVAKLTKRDTAKGVAVLRIEGVETEMSLDDVCQFMGE